MNPLGILLIAFSLILAAVALLWVYRLQQKSRELKEQAKQVLRLRQVEQCLNCIHAGLIVTSLDGTILECNPAAEHILEAPSLSLKGKDIRSFYPVGGTYEDLWRRASDEGRIPNRSIVISSTSGTKKLVNLSMARVANGKGAQIVHSFQDCADLRTMEERLVQTERLATIGKFASQIAHEVRNPLSSISLNVELLEDELKGSSDEARQLLASVMRELERLNNIVNEYLQFSRFPKPHLRKGRVDGVIREMVEQFRKHPNVNVSAEMVQPSPEIWIDDGLLRQALQNLLRNAVEAIDGEGEIRVETDLIDRFMLVRVRDSGRGISQDIIPKLFEPFFTTKANGTGVGLAITQQIIFEHNGHLQVDSQPGRGSTFTIYLPL